ncbi:MAG TPA: SDR family NAD(P)-dependent oxidoreductase, partial [Pseudomonadales bacterium]|nr:SDR family NAD(P)-dependent oxidoreductase [Pseudomonadales bacterium]
MLAEQFSLHGKIAIVTGSGKGIGKAIGLAFAEAGATVVFAARTQTDLDAVVAQAKTFGGDALGVNCDVLVEAQLQH